MAFKKEAFIEELKSMSVLELKELVEAIEETFGVSATPVAAAAVAGVSTAAAASFPALQNALAPLLPYVMAAAAACCAVLVALVRLHSTPLQGQLACLSIKTVLSCTGEGGGGHEAGLEQFLEAAAQCVSSTNRHLMTLLVCKTTI